MKHLIPVLLLSFSLTLVSCERRTTTVIEKPVIVPQPEEKPGVQFKIEKEGDGVSIDVESNVETEKK